MDDIQPVYDLLNKIIANAKEEIITLQRQKDQIQKQLQKSRKEEAEKAKQLQDLLSLEKLISEKPTKEEKVSYFEDKLKVDGEKYKLQIDVLKKEQVQIEHELPEYIRLTELTNKIIRNQKNNYLL